MSLIACCVAAPFLPVRDDLHPKRNQARQKFATLPEAQFKTLNGDILYELGRRYPELKEYEVCSFSTSRTSNTTLLGQIKTAPDDPTPPTPDNEDIDNILLDFPQPPRTTVQSPQQAKRSYSGSVRRTSKDPYYLSDQATSSDDDAREDINRREASATSFIPRAFQDLQPRRKDYHRTSPEPISRSGSLYALNEVTLMPYACPQVNLLSCQLSPGDSILKEAPLPHAKHLLQTFEGVLLQSPSNTLRAASNTTQPAEQGGVAIVFTIIYNPDK